jgi:uncharacterized membrane protein (UPF0127 family)
MKKMILPLLVAAMTVSTTGCGDTKSKKSLTRVVTFKKEGELRLLKKESDSLLASIDIEIAEDEYETQTGLMYRKGMDENQGMLFIFPNETMRSFYMKNTEFSIDIIFLNNAGEVVNIHKNAKPLDPTSLPSTGPVKYVLEVNAGLSDRWQLRPGDRIDWQRDQ